MSFYLERSPKRIKEIMAYSSITNVFGQNILSYKIFKFKVYKKDSNLNRCPFKFEINELYIFFKLFTCRTLGTNLRTMMQKYINICSHSSFLFQLVFTKTLLWITSYSIVRESVPDNPFSECSKRKIKKNNAQCLPF
jgi:hypothetical protein